MEYGLGNTFLLSRLWLLKICCGYETFLRGNDSLPRAIELKMKSNFPDIAITFSTYNIMGTKILLNKIYPIKSSHINGKVHSNNVYTYFCTSMTY